MNRNLVVVELGPQSLLALKEAKGTRVRCLLGTLWITEEANRKDVVLGPGQVFELRGAGRALVQAIGASRASIEAASGRPELAFPAVGQAA